MDRERFSRLVARSIEDLPEEFCDRLENIDVVVEDEPTAGQKKKLNIHPNWTLFGLYEGVPKTKRGAGYFGVLPDKITIFQKPIENEAAGEKDIEEIVKNTVWHEIAHHFGMDEARVQRAEAKRREIHHL